MRVKNLFKKLILLGLIFGIVFSFLGIYKVYAQEKLSKDTIIKSNEQKGYDFYKPKKYKFYMLEKAYTNNKNLYYKVDYKYVGKYDINAADKIIRYDDVLQHHYFSNKPLKFDEPGKLYMGYDVFPYEYGLNDGDSVYEVCEYRDLHAVSSRNLDEFGGFDFLNFSISAKSEILPNGQLKLSNFKYVSPTFKYFDEHTQEDEDMPEKILGDIYAKIDTRKLGIDFENLEYTLNYYIDGKEIKKEFLHELFDKENLFNMPKLYKFYTTEYKIQLPKKNWYLERLLRNDADENWNAVEKNLYTIFRIPRQFLEKANNENTYVTISHFNGLPDTWKDKISILEKVEFFGAVSSGGKRKENTYMLDTEMAAKLLNKRMVNGNPQYDIYADFKNLYNNVILEDGAFKEFAFKNIVKSDGLNFSICNTHIFGFDLFNNESISNHLYSSKPGKHTITKIDDVVIKDRNISDFKKMLHDHLSNQIEGNKLTDILDEDFELKSTDDLFSLDDTEIEKLKKEYQEFFDNPGSYSKTYKMKLTVNKDFLHKNYIPYDKSTWEPDIDLYLNIVFSKPVVNIEFRNYFIDNGIYTFYTTNLDNYSFLENIKVTERKHNEEINISYKAVVNGDTLNLYRLDNPNFKLNSNPIKFRIVKFPAELIGNKSWYLIKTNTVSNEDVIRHYKIQSLDGDKYMIDVIKNPMLEKGDNVKNGYLELDIVSTTNLLKSYTYLIPVYRDSKLETKFKNDTDDAKYFNSSNPTLVNQVIHPLKYKLNVDKIRDRFLYASLFDKAVNIEAVNKNNYYKSVDLVYKQIYLAKDDDVALENQATHTITYAVNRAFDKKFFISSAGTGNYIFHKSNNEKMTKEELLNNLASFYQGKIDNIRLSKVDIKGKELPGNTQDEVLDRFLKEPNTALKERIFIEGIKNGERVFVNQFMLENVDDNYFISKDGNITNPGKKEDPSIKDEAKSFLTDYKMYFIVAGSGILGLVFLLIVLKIVFPSKKERKKKLMKLFEKNAYSKDLREKLSDFFISRKYKKNRISEVVKIINTYLDKKIPEDEIIEIINNAIRNDYDNLDFTSL